MNSALVGAALLLQVAGGWNEGPDLPRPVTNNAVVAVDTEQGPAVFSFLGLGSSRMWDGVVDWAFRWNVENDAWVELDPVPGPPRLASTAEAVDGRIYLFGGYTVAEDGTEESLGRVDVYDPDSGRWSEAAPMPVAVDDAVSGVWRDSLIYLVSGWHDRANEILVQVYDPAMDQWAQATPIPGPPVFGHAGGIVRDAIVYVDGVKIRPLDETPEGGSRFVMASSAWRGDIHPDDPTLITWRRLPDHPGPPVYRSGGGVLGTRVVFVGGTDNPYNYDGIGYDGEPSTPVGTAFVYDVGARGWREVTPPPVPTMDHRGAVRAGGLLIVAGGMEAGRQVTDRVWTIPVVRLLTGG